MYREWVVEWYAPFDMSNENLEPADFARARRFYTREDAERFKDSLPKGSLDVAVVHAPQGCFA